MEYLNLHALPSPGAHSVMFVQYPSQGGGGQASHAVTVSACNVLHYTLHYINRYSVDSEPSLASSADNSDDSDQ